jgi:Integrase core domain
VTASSKRDARWFLLQLSPLIRPHLISIALTVLGSSMFLLDPLLIKWLIDRVLPKKDTGLLLTVAAGLLGIIEVGQGLRGEDVVRTLNRITSHRGRPKFLFCDNGSGFTSQSMDLWAYQNGVQINYSRPGKPTDNAHVESFNGTLRAECLDAHWFDSLVQARQIIEAWRREYNESRPHRALGERTPMEFACQLAVEGSLPGSQAAENSP